MELNNIKSSKINWGDAAKDLNQNFGKINNAIEQVKNATTRNKGYFSTDAVLKSAFKSASLGDIAYVGSEYPYQTWEWNGSEWTKKNDNGGDESVNLGDYYTKEDTDAKLSELGSEVIDSNWLNANNLHLLQYKKTGALGVNNVINENSSWETYYNIPVSIGDAMYRRGIASLSEGFATLLVMDESYNIVDVITDLTFLFTVKNNGYVSLCINRGEQVFGLIKKDLIKQEKLCVSLIEGNAWSNTTGENIATSDWKGSETLIPVIPHRTYNLSIKVTNVILYDTNKRFIKSLSQVDLFDSEEAYYIGINIRNTSSYYAYVKYLHIVDVTYTKANLDNIIPTLDTQQKRIENLENNCIPKKSIDIEPYKQVKKALLDTNTLVENQSWDTYLNIPVKVGDIVEKVGGEGGIIYGFASVLVMDNEYNILYSTIDTDVNYLITEDGYVSIMNHRGTPSDVSVSSTMNINDVIHYLRPITIKWCAIGDSITAGNEDNNGTSYATFAADMLGEKVELQKLGYWGHKMLDTLATTAFNVIDDDVPIVTVNFGSNDLSVTSKWMNITIDSIMSKQVEELADNVSTFESLRLFVEKMRQSHPSTLIYVITPLRRSDRTDEVMNKFVELEKEICTRLAIPCIDAHNESGIRKGDSTYLLYEKSSSGEMVYVHPNDLGKKLIARWLVSKINFNQII